MSDWPEIIELKGYSPKDGDVLFINAGNYCTPENVEAIREAFLKLLPNVRPVILTGGVTIESVEPLESK